MKRIVLFCILVLASVFGFAQNEEMTDVVILMKAQYNRTELCRKADFFATRAERRAYVVKELKDFSEASQHEVRNLLTDLERQGLVSSIHSLWSANALYFSATESVIASLSSRNDIEYVGPITR